MPSSLVYDVDVDVPAAQMYGYFTTVGYWEDLVEHYRATSQTETPTSSDETGTDITFAHITSAQDLPPAARRVISGVRSSSNASSTSIRSTHRPTKPSDATAPTFRFHSTSPATMSCTTPNGAVGCG